MRLKSGDWLGHSRTLMCFFLSHSLTPFLLPWPCVLGHCHAGIPLHDPFSMPWLQCPGPDGTWPVHRPFDAVQLSCPLSIMFPPPCLTVGMVFLGSWAAFLVLQTQRVELMRKSWILVSSDHHNFIQFSSESLTSDGPVHVLSWAGGSCGCCRISVLYGVVLKIVTKTALSVFYWFNMKKVFSCFYLYTKKIFRKLFQLTNNILLNLMWY